jgi:hypothetical protein
MSEMPNTSTVDSTTCDRPDSSAELPLGLLSPPEVARILNVTVPTLANWRSAIPRRGPRFLRCGGIRYRERDVLEYLESRMIGTAEQPLPPATAPSKQRR